MTANGVMAVPFIFAAAVQVNDPDPAAVVGAIAAVQGAVIARGVRDPRMYTFLFDAWEMRSAAIEEARKASGS